MSGIDELEAVAHRGDLRLWYVAHPVRPTDEEVAAWAKRLEGPIMSMVRSAPDLDPARLAVLDNVANAKRWLAWLVRRFSNITFIAPYIASLDGGGDDDSVPEQRVRGLRDCCRTVDRCDGVVNVGGRVSDGMLVEMQYARVTVDLTYLGRSPPAGDLVSDVVDQPPPVPRPDLVPVWENVISDFRTRYEDALDGVADEHKATAYNVLNDMSERDQVGRERYGTPLTTDNGRDHLVDAYQELLDGAVYLRAAWLEGAQVRDTYYALLDAVMKTRLAIDARGATK